MYSLSANLCRSAVSMPMSAFGQLLSDHDISSWGDPMSAFAIWPGLRDQKHPVVLILDRMVYFHTNTLFNASVGWSLPRLKF
jgi:hypothetical protein